jgi:ribosomal protein L44E
MARGQQKLQSQKKNLEKQGAKSKQVDNKAAAKAALHYTCSICKTQMPDIKSYGEHWQSKHSKLPLPAELAQANGGDDDDE